MKMAQESSFEGQRISSSICRMAAMQTAILLVNITGNHYGSLGTHRPERGYIPCIFSLMDVIFSCPPTCAGVLLCFAAISLILGLSKMAGSSGVALQRERRNGKEHSKRFLPEVINYCIFYIHTPAPFLSQLA